jgi:hypothetical protein
MEQMPVSIWTYQDTISRRLLSWSALSIVAGLAVTPLNSYWRGFGWQAVGWGVIDAAIAYFGRASARKRQSQPDAALRVERERRNLSLLLWINVGLDALYMLGGRRLTQRRHASRMLRGTGWGIVLQGAFLFIFDLYHAASIPRGGLD